MPAIKKKKTVKAKPKAAVKKKALVKKKTTKKRAPKRMAAKIAKVEKITVDPNPMPMPKPMPGPELESGCDNCGHMPMNVTALIGVLVGVIAILSLTVLGSGMILNSQAFQIQAANSQGELVDTYLNR